MRKLQAYKLPSGVVGVTVTSWEDVDLNGNPPFVALEALDPAYEDVSSITHWDGLGQSTDADYTYRREAIAAIVSATGFANLSEEDQKTAARLFTVNKADRDMVLTEDEQRAAWAILVEASIQCRAARWNRAKTYISYRLNVADSSDLAISTSDLCTNYVNYNITSHALCGRDGLYDFLQGTSAYAGGGFPYKPYWTQEYQDRLMEILTTGY